eukprot:TRINITY_DN358_c0_g1_i5.p1 TRINITY_DN358_c0_g1~~TRINITY_DN358_c0_g1_i5.p1  ORF type:complete len:303 (+),score=76.23 TRINITY_DN358_c0_g1_i5:97-909(+)
MASLSNTFLAPGVSGVGVVAAPAPRTLELSATPAATNLVEDSSSSAPLATFAAAVTFAATGAAAGKRGRRTARRFFGGESSPAPVKNATSYKDYQDPWLGSADLGFDPFNLAITGGVFDTAASAVPETTYYNYRESEVKHGRFAMTAFLAIFAESADRNALFNQLGQNSADNLDGTLGLDEVQAPVLLIGLGYQALAEYNLQRDETDGNILSVQYKRDRIPGNLGFDPLSLGSSPQADLKGLHNIEANAGRLAMIGITSFLVREFIAKDL